jgi:hypothetical protein
MISHIIKNIEAGELPLNKTTLFFKNNSEDF